MSAAVVHDANHITDPCQWVYANGRTCGRSGAAHDQNTRLEHRWVAYRLSNPRCVQCGVSVRGWGHKWPTGTVSCSDCYFADWAVGG